MILFGMAKELSHQKKDILCGRSIYSGCQVMNSQLAKCFKDFKCPNVYANSYSIGIWAAVGSKPPHATPYPLNLD